MEKLTIKFKKLSEKAQVPTQGTLWDAWYDLCATENYVLKSWERKLFKTNIAMAIPLWYYWRIAPRSWLAYKHWIDVLAWVIDHWYRNDVGIILINFWDNDFEVKEWDRIAQMIIEKCADCSWEESDVLEDSERGLWWYWSTWVSK